MKDIFNDIDKHIMGDEKPSIYMKELFNAGKLDTYPLDMLKKLVDAPQSPKHHPEGNVWNHVMMVLDNGAKYRHLSYEKREFMWAALLHDIGKPATTRIRKGRITSYDHDKVGAKMVEEFLRYFGEEEEFIKKVSRLVRWHMQALFVINNLPFKDIETMIKEVPIHEIGLLTLCDRLGRGELDEEKIKDTEYHVNEFLKVVCDEAGVETIQFSVLM